MDCPICAPLALQPIVLAGGPPAHACPRCGGQFVAAAIYQEWRAQLSVDTVPPPDYAASEIEAEPARAKQCPHCRHLLLPYRVALDLPSTVEHCGACNGVWLDRGEWDALRRRGLHSHLNQLFTEPWQRRLRAEEHRAHMDTIYREKFGEGDYAEARRVKAWLDAHPQRLALRAYFVADEI